MFNFYTGEIILIDKPLTWTSFEAVNKLKHGLKKHPSLFHDNKFVHLKIGHAGTLDPLATGLLIVCTGKKTKIIASIQEQPKEYTGTFFLGATTPSFDLEKLIDHQYPTEHITEKMILDAAKSFLGKQEQTPPIYSALNVNGERAYDLARQGKEVELRSKPIEIFEFEITEIKIPEVSFRIKSSKGTYIRSIGRDFGLALKSGAHLSKLCRTKIGDYKLEDALSPEDFLKRVQPHL
jgi:tRNA pseudouridine55 synthase